MAIFGSNINPALGRVDYSPIAQGMAMGGQLSAQGLTNMAQGIAKGIEVYAQKQEQKKQEVAATEMISGVFKANPFLAKGFNLTVDEKGEFDKGALREVIRGAGSPGQAVQLVAALDQMNRARQQQEKELADRARLEQFFTQTPAGAAIAGGARFESLPVGAEAFLPRQFGNAQELLQAGQRAGIPVTQLLSVAKGLADINRVEAETRATLAPKGTAKTETYEKTENGIPYKVTVRTNPDGTTTELGRVRTDIQPGMRPSPEGGVEPIPGSDPDLKRKAATEAATKLYDSGLQQGTQVLEAISRAKNIVKNAATPVQGLGSTVFGWTPTAADLDAQYDQIRSINVLDTIRQARAESPTGGSPYGQLNMKEFDAAGAVKGALNRSMSDESALTNMDMLAKVIFTAYPQLKDQYKSILEGANVRPAPRLKVGRFSGDIVSP